MGKKSDVISIFAPTEYDLEGQCPFCGERVLSCYNKKFCGLCGKKITWNVDKVFENSLEAASFLKDLGF